MPTDEKRYSMLARQLRNFDYVIIDTCSLMEDSFPDWMNVFEKAKKEYVDDVVEDFHVYVPYRCYEELKEHAKNKSKDPDDINRQIAAKRAIRIVKWAKFRRILEITPKDKAENFSDNAITVKVIHDRLDKRILVITQDKGLASDLLYWNHSQSQRGKYVAVYRLMPNAELAPNRGKPIKEQTPQPKQPTKYEPTAKPSFTHAKPTKPESPKPAPKVDYDASFNDKRLKALLTNPNYPLDKKRKDVQAHLEGLATIPEEKRSTLNLQLNEGALRQFLLTGVYTEKTFTPPVVLEKEDNPELEIKKLRYSDGLTLKEAISKCASLYNILFRYHTIPYNAQFHGPVDLTDIDLDDIARLADRSLDGNSLIRVEYKKVLIYVMPRNVTFRVWINIAPATARPLPADKKPEKAKKKAAKKNEKPAEPAPINEKQPVEQAPKVEEQKPAEPVKPSKPAKKKPAKKKNVKSSKQKKAAQPKPEEAKPEPNNEPKKESPKKKPVLVKPEETKQPVKEEKPATKPAKAKKKKQSEVKKEKKTEAPKAKPETPKPAPAKKQEATAQKPAEEKPKQKAASKPAKKEKKQEKPNPTPKKEKKAPAPKKPEKPKVSPFDEAIAFDKKLKANVNNPNYPLASKVADLKAQLERVKKLKVEERKQLSLSADTIKMMVSMLESSK